MGAKSTTKAMKIVDLGVKVILSDLADSCRAEDGEWK
jgi:hypothetical protein